MIFTKDIHQKIRKEFRLNEVEEVEKELKQRVDNGLNVGPNQFVRSVIFLANKSIEELKSILLNFDDPRDVVGEAEYKSGELGHWFAIPFEEIEQLNGEKYSGEIFNQNQKNQNDEFPF